MEQGRRRPSPNVVDAQAAALRLSPDEHGHLRTLAGFAAPAGRSGLVPRETTPAAAPPSARRWSRVCRPPPTVIRPTRGCGP
ncbi:hypothetical protein AB0C29_46460 [Actinoplanes sp. NPDC048791]|uniref:hypothetical protein n=1 Tax=Actinoplanes sp. NPDC048791 TaxID=3154623 RepID=UPI0033E5A886